VYQKYIKKKKKVSNVQNKIIFHEILEGQKEKLEKLQNKDEILQTTSEWYYGYTMRTGKKSTMNDG